MRAIGETIRAIVPRDNKSGVPVEYCVIFALIALFIGIKGFALACNHRPFSAVAVTLPARPLATQQDWDFEKTINERRNRGGELALTADSGRASTAMTNPDLVPTTFRMMGNVVYLHTPTGKFLMEVGSLSSSELGMKLDLGTTTAHQNEAVEPSGSHINLVNNNDDHLIPAIEDASIIRTSECNAGDNKDTSEALTRKGRRGYKQLVRNQTVKIEPEQNYSPGQVAAALNLSYDSALRRMLKMKGVVDLGTPTRRYKRGKKKLRISGKNLLAFLRSKTIV
jgi:hypothetical protein